MTVYAPVFAPAGTQFFVDATAPAAVGDGSYQQPFTTIAAAQAVMAAGDVCTIRAGNYDEDLAFTAGQDFRFHADSPGSVVIVGATVITDATMSFEGINFIDDGVAGTDAIHFTGTAADTLTLIGCNVDATAAGLAALSMDNTAGTVVVLDSAFASAAGNANQTIQVESGNLDMRRTDVLHGSNVAEALVSEGDAATSILCVGCRFQGSVNGEAAVGAAASHVYEDCNFVVGAISAVIIAATCTIVVDGATITSTDAANDAIDGAGTLTIGKPMVFAAAADEIAATLTVTHLLGSQIQHNSYTEAAGAGARAITFAQPFPTANVDVVCDGDWTATTILATGFTLNTSGNGTSSWIAIHD